MTEKEIKKYVRILWEELVHTMSHLTDEPCEGVMVNMAWDIFGNEETMKELNIPYNPEWFN